jgi:uncharacterized repeat protein (TIGR01451 family)
MKSKVSRYISILGVVIGLITAASPVLAADIDQNKLECVSQSEVEVLEDVPAVCDFGIQKQVAINGGVTNDADTIQTAVKANIGSTVTYKITLSSYGTSLPYGVYYIKDVLPAQLQYVSHQTAFGSYETTTNLWALDDNATFPAVLTLTATVLSGGLIDNVAGLEFFAYCASECATNEYVDDNPQNNSDHAYINVATTPQVLGASTTTPQVLAETGSSLVLQSIAAVLITVTAVLIAFKKNFKKQTRS